MELCSRVSSLCFGRSSSLGGARVVALAVARRAAVRRTDVQVDPPHDALFGMRSRRLATGRGTIAHVECVSSVPVTDADDQADSLQQSPRSAPSSAPRSTAVSAGDLTIVAAAERWVREHGDVLWRFAMARARSKEIAEEIIQETIVAAMLAFDRFSAASSEQTWLLGIASHKIADHFRQLQRTARRGESSTHDGAGIDASDMQDRFDKRGKWANPPQKWDMRGDGAAENAEMSAALRTCVDALPPSLAETVWLRDIVGMPAEDVCKALDLTATNLWTRMHRARSALRACIERTIGMRHEEVSKLKAAQPARSVGPGGQGSP